MIRKIRLISKFIVSQSGKQTIAINIVPNISRSKGNQTMKFSHLIEYNMKDIFLEKSYAQWSRETIPRPLSKKSKLSIFRDQQSKVLYSLFLLYACFCFYFIVCYWVLSKCIETKLQITCFYLKWSFFKKQKNVWN